MHSALQYIAHCVRTIVRGVVFLVTLVLSAVGWSAPALAYLGPLVILDRLSS